MKMNLIHSVVTHTQMQVNNFSLAEGQGKGDMRCGFQCAAVVSIWVFKKLIKRTGLKPDAVGRFYPLGILNKPLKRCMTACIVLG